MPTQDQLNLLVRRGLTPKRVYNALVALTNSGGGGGGNITNVIRDMGDYNASGNTFPITGGSGIIGGIMKGDEFTFTTAGTFGGYVYPIGTIARAKVDTPGQIITNWRLY